ncbi:MAG: hypothetical protein QXU11_02930 [Thermoproteota archaeon]
MNRKDEKTRILITIPGTLYKKISRVEDEETLRSFSECVSTHWIGILTKRSCQNS